MTLAVRPVMWISPQRVLYAGLLGQVTPRAVGAWAVYAAIDEPLQLRTGTGAWEEVQAAVVPPGARHEVRSRGRRAGVLLVEPEDADAAPLARRLSAPGHGGLHETLVPRLRALCARLAEDSGAAPPRLDNARLDEALFGMALPTRRLDARIAAVAAALREQPFSAHAGEQAAAATGLSYSRFLHLFKDEVGVPFRALRTWKRARALLHHVNRPVNFAQLALDCGYPDSTHFSHSVRQVYGLRPRDIFAGSRRLALVVAAG